VVAVANLVKGVVDIIDRCSGDSQTILLVALLSVTLLIASLSLAVSGIALLGYSIFFNSVSTIVFDAALQHFCLS
jgi:hypothetical protein